MIQWYTDSRHDGAETSRGQRDEDGERKEDLSPAGGQNQANRERRGRRGEGEAGPDETRGRGSARRERERWWIRDMRGRERLGYERREASSFHILL